MASNFVAGGGGEILCYFYFYVAEISFTGYAFSLFFGGIGGFGCACWTTFQSAVPVMGYKWFLLVLLGGTVRVYVIDVWEIDLEAELEGDQRFDSIRLGDGYVVTLPRSQRSCRLRRRVSVAKYPGLVDQGPI